jgi:hypothetical protein
VVEKVSGELGQFAEQKYRRRSETFFHWKKPGNSGDSSNADDKIYICENLKFPFWG